MSEDRPILDILAECIRTARLGPTAHSWPDLVLDMKDDALRTADRTIRLLEARGVRLARAGEPDPAEPLPTTPVIYSDKIIGRNAERQLRKGIDDKWEVLKAEDGQTAVQLTFTLAHAYDLAGRALQGDREVANAPGILTTLAAALEIHRCHAVTMRTA